MIHLGKCLLLRHVLYVILFLLHCDHITRILTIYLLLNLRLFSLADVHVNMILQKFFAAEKHLNSCLQNFLFSMKRNEEFLNIVMMHDLFYVTRPNKEIISCWFQVNSCKWLEPCFYHFVFKYCVNQIDYQQFHTIYIWKLAGILVSFHVKLVFHSFSISS